MSDAIELRNMYDAWNHAEHAYRLTECAQSDLRRGDATEARESLRSMLKASEMAAYHARQALEQLEKHMKDAANG